MVRYIGMKSELKNILYTLIGCFILALGVGLFILPNNIITGGVAGITVLLKAFYPSLNETYVVAGINIFLFILGFVVLGKKFATVTFLSSFAYPFFLWLIDMFIEPIITEPIIATIYGGLLIGIGVGLVARTGGSTGGMDIPPLILSKFTGIDPSKTITVFDAIIVILGIWIYGIEAVLIGLFSIFFEGFGIDKAMNINSGYKAKEIRIISEKYLEISKEILEILERGTTIINAKGGYSDEDRPMLLVVCSNKEYDQIIDIIHKYDEKAFVIVTETKDVHGEGFTFTPRI